MISLVFTGCSSKGDPYNSSYTESILSTAIRTMSDSDFTEYSLIGAIYTNAFSNYTKVESFLPENLSDTLPTLFEGSPNDALINATVAYGGKETNDKKIGEIKASNTLRAKQLIVGDILFININDTYSHYIYDKDGFVNLCTPLEKVDTNEVLNSIPDSKQFAVIRIMCNMTNNDFVEGKLPDLKLSKEQQALISTAQSYLLRGDKLQYVSFSGLSSENYIGVNSPENYTDDNYGPIQCSGFCYDVYKQALGMELKYEDIYVNSTAEMFEYSPAMNILKYVMYCNYSNSYTDSDKERITNEILDMLEPGDILVVRRAGNSGHAMLYVGNGNIIHASGDIYNTKTRSDNYEATVRQMRFKDYFCIEGMGGYLFGADVGKRVEKFCVIRPLDIYDGEIPEATKNRMENLSGVMAQKLSSHNISLTADIGEEITYTFEIYNQNDKEITLDVSDIVPEKCQYVSGADNVNDNNLSWKVTIPANTRKKVSYTVKVSEDAKKGDIIVSNGGLVGGVPVNCPGVTVNNSLTSEQQKKLTETIKEYNFQKDATAIETVNDIYKKALGWDNVFTDNDFDEIYGGKNGIFSQEEDGLSLREDSKYSSMVAPKLCGGYGTKEGKLGKTIVMPAKEQQFVVGDILVCKFADNERCLYLYAGEGVLYDLLNGYNIDERTVQGRMEYFLRTDLAYAVLRPSLVK